MLPICCSSNSNSSITRTTTIAPRLRLGPIWGITPLLQLPLPVLRFPLVGLTLDRSDQVAWVVVEELLLLLLPPSPPLLLPPFTQANHDSSYNIHFDKMIINNNERMIHTDTRSLMKSKKKCKEARSKITFTKNNMKI